MRRPVVVLVVLAVLVPVRGWAQGSGRFLTGPIGWTPTIALKDAGIDSNVLDSPTDRQKDRTATISPSVDASMTLARFKVQGTALTEYVYFERVANQRSFTRRFNARVEAPFTRVVPNGTAAYERARERTGPEIDYRIYHTTKTYGLGLNLFVMARGAIQVGGRREQTINDRGQVVRDVDVAERFNRDSDTAQLGFRFNVTDLTSISANASLVRDRFTLSPDQNTSNVNWGVLVQFAPDAVIRGQAGIGYHIMDPRGASASAFRGYTANVDLTYQFLGRTRLTGRYFRDTSYSLEAPFFVQNTLGLDIEQLIGGPILLIARANRQKSDYPENIKLATVARVDYLDTVAGGVGVRLSDTSRVTVTYELGRRQSSLEAL